MGSANRSIRFKIFLLLLLPLLSLSAMWGFVLNLTVGDGVSLLRAADLYQSVGLTSTELGLQLQAERTQASVVVSSRESVSGVGEQRARTDRAAEAFRKASADGDSGSPELRASLTGLLRQLDRLPAIRAGVDSSRHSRLSALASYNQILDSVFLIYDQMSAVPDLAIFQQASAMQSMGNAREMIARENALVSGALIDHQLSHDERHAFADYVATRRFLHTRGLAALDAELGKPYRDTFSSTAFEKFTELEKAIIESSGDRLPPQAASWKATANGVATWLDQIGLSSSKKLSERAGAVATDIMIRIAIAGGVGLVAVVASIIFSVRFGRRLAGELAGLRSAALDLADVRLPRVMERLRRGEEVDVQAEAPPIKAGGSAEVHDVAHAFGSVQRTAVEAAVGQANLRRGVSQVFVNLARRKQSLLHRQLTLLDSMQRRSTDPDGLEDLFRLDHLTTRMRRHAESLIILSGAAPGRAWRKPVPVVDVLRAAIAEVEDYTRVNVLPLPEVSLDGSAVADLTHLVAELIENATIFSPPQTTVTVRGDVVANGFAVEVEDRGLGLSSMEYAAINERLADPPEFDLADSDRLGLFVVGQLASRHGVQVMLRASPFGGTTAIVLIPRALIAESDTPLSLTAERTPFSSAERTPFSSADRAGEPAGSVPRSASDPAPAASRAGAGEDRPSGGLPRRTRSVPPSAASAGPSLSVVTDLPARGPANGRSGTRSGDPGNGRSAARSDDPANGRPGTLPGDPAGQPARRESIWDAGSRPLQPQEPPEGPGKVGETSGEDPAGRTATTGHGGPTRHTAVEPPKGPGGLPRRIRQANLAPQLRQEPEATPADRAPKTGPCEERSPEEVRALFSAFQAGARRGREEQSTDFAHHMTGDKGDE
ncbi:signal transduction histidine kinase [Streptosporangium becharense]|uniref:histidine kinase n=1 Tax=Streptosporangium becharense TaxID=1816182 RepID=A0A7W9MH18_9ACTN|nr:nitrate- and nitrite sensing domain-containing protein [Streptosporangium becharense]MBB2908891.1 signal transduction histidine kinase [Streptosporangium becharense]MBB5820091.1 signal transduction histidine kinase [Streptosporangium becharense]